MASIMGDDEELNLVVTSFSLVRYNNPVVIDKNDEPPKSPIPSGKSKGGGGRGGDSDDGGKRPKSAGEVSDSSLAAKQVRSSWFSLATLPHHVLSCGYLIAMYSESGYCVRHRL